MLMLGAKCWCWMPGAVGVGASPRSKYLDLGGTAPRRSKHLDARPARDAHRTKHRAPAPSTKHQHSALSSPTLPAEQPSLRIDAPSISAGAAVGADDPMAGHDNSDRIGCAGAGDGANGAGLADGPRHVTVRSRLTARDGGELAPDAPLERGAANVERQHACLRRAFGGGARGLGQRTQTARWRLGNRGARKL